MRHFIGAAAVEEIGFEASDRRIEISGSILAGLAVLNAVCAVVVLALG